MTNNKFENNKTQHMKKLIKNLGILAFVFMASMAFSQTPPPPNNGNTGGGGGNPVGGGAPVGSGLVILVAMAAAYGGQKYSTAPEK